MAKPLLIDTDVIIDFSRQRAEAVHFMRTLSARAMLSAITVAELYAGVRDGQERAWLDDLVARSVVVPLDAQIAERGGLINRQYRPSHGVGFADAMIAATAEIERATLITLNARHFPMLSDLTVHYTR